MTAVNKAAWVGNLYGAEAPLKVPGKFKAGATQAIKRGEILILSSGDWVPISSDTSMSGVIAVADKEIVSGDLAGFHMLIVPRPGDVFEFALDTAASVPLTTALYYSASQTLTATTGSNIIAYALDDSVYPLQGTKRGGELEDAGTSTISAATVRCVFKASVSYFAAIAP